MSRTCLALLLMISAPRAEASTAISLEEAFRHAVSATETLQIRNAIESQAEEKLSQAKGAIFPKLSGIGTYQLQDAAGTTSSSTSSSTRREQTTARINLSQPLFQGLREFAALRGYQANLRAEKAGTHKTRLDLYQDVADAFYDVMASEQDSKDLEKFLELSKTRVKILTERVRIGRSRKSELLSAESQVAVAQAQLENAQLEIREAREKLGTLTGLPPHSELNDTSSVLSGIRPLDQYLSSIESRPDIVSSKEALESLEENRSVAHGAHWPSLDLSGNYYLHRTVLPDTKWDLGLTLTIPIFQGGTLSSKTAEAAQQVRAQELELSQGRRTANEEIKTAHARASTSLARLQTLKIALELAEKAYQETSREDRLGLVSSLEALQAVNSYVDAQRQYDRAIYETKKNLVSLETAAGKMP